MYRYIFILLSSLLWSFDGPPAVTEKHDGLDRSLARKFEVLSESNDNAIRIKLVDDEANREYHVSLTSATQYRHYLHGDILQRRGLLPDPKTFDKQTILVALENAIQSQRYMTVRHLVPHAFRIDRSSSFRDKLKDLLQHYADKGHAICAFEYARVRLRDLNRTRPPYVQKDGLLRIPTPHACALYDHQKYLALGFVALQAYVLQCFHPNAIPPMTCSRPLQPAHFTPETDWFEDYPAYVAALRQCAPLDDGTPFYETFIDDIASRAGMEQMATLCRETLEGTKTLPSPRWVQAEHPNLQTEYEGPFTHAHYAFLLQLIEQI